MITITRGNLLESDVEALVNTVNCVGHMGKGIALQFKKAFPNNFRDYQRACRAKKVRPGKMLVHETDAMSGPRLIINFPTKDHWRGKSRIEYIKAGLVDLVEVLRQHEIKSVAVPPLGCGLGGLEWDEVRPMIEQALAQIPDIDATLFEPAGAPEAKAMPVGTARPQLTVARALFIRLMEQYEVMAYRLTLLEMQKLAYFLQEAGQPLKLRYVAHLYGPYAHNLNMVLEKLEGHFIRGYGDTQNPDVEIELLPNAAAEASQFLSEDTTSAARLERVADLIDGFETPYGMELLSSVHWVAHHAEPAVGSEAEALRAVHAWNDRKRAMFKPQHVRIAWERLNSSDWLPKTVSS